MTNQAEVRASTLFAGAFLEKLSEFSRFKLELLSAMPGRGQPLDQLLRGVIHAESAKPRQSEFSGQVRPTTAKLKPVLGRKALKQILFCTLDAARP
jgi:hypothetical protein